MSGPSGGAAGVAASEAGRIDLGKVGMCGVGGALVPLYLTRSVHEMAAANWLHAITYALIASFYTVVVFAYLRRGRAVATGSVLTAQVAAVVATWLPLVAPFVARHDHSSVMEWAGDALLIGGLGWSIWALATLGRNLSVIPQARSVVTAGPYGIVRHPLYLGELVMLLGVLLGGYGLWLQLLWCVMVLLQLYRMHHEESLLFATLPDYGAYRTSVKRLVPFVY